MSVLSQLTASLLSLDTSFAERGNQRPPSCCFTSRWYLREKLFNSLSLPYFYVLSLSRVRRAFNSRQKAAKMDRLVGSCWKIRSLGHLESAHSFLLLIYLLSYECGIRMYLMPNAGVMFCHKLLLGERGEWGGKETERETEIATALDAYRRAESDHEMILLLLLLLPLFSLLSFVWISRIYVLAT